ncbi:scavenger receptor cysteine-rich type 1 protein M130-like, partial [Eleutherodactylus coqui]|uniref:scavenger receptor cysteine-rich type 1 protein M130-like n=1 Tax=Eleutherodactylus coqui TaxID=57060 RepID=UPI003461E7CF
MCRQEDAVSRPASSCSHVGGEVDLPSSRIAPVRLYGGNTECEGLLEVRYKEEWRAVYYDTGNRENIANMICRELGCNTANVQHRVTTREIFVDGYRRRLYLYCTGEESSLSQCDYDIYNGLYHSGSLMEVLCSGHREYRLVNGPHPCSGYLETRAGGDTWESVCEIDAEPETANVICRELRCGDAVPSLLNYTRRPGPIWREKIHCVGNESSLYDCLRRDVEGNCTKQNPPAIECKAPVRLYGGNTECEGLVEVRYKEEWMGVDYYIKNRESIANIVCRELGCNTANLQHRVTRGNIFVDDYRRSLDLLCTGGESSLMQCEYFINDDIMSPSAYLTGVLCSVQVRFSQGNTECEGLVEVRYEGEWWGVEYCGGSRENIANVVCRELGCNTANLQHRVTTGEIFVDDDRRKLSLRCTGKESSLSQCEYSTYGGRYSSGSLMGVKCSAPVRLYGGNTECEGLVEVRYKEEWMGVYYDTGNRENIANIVCRELGCNTANAQHRLTRGEIFVDDYRRSLDLKCTGGESSLSQCHDSIHDGLYPFASLIGVRCSGHREYRLADGATACSGHLEALHGDTWGSVCEIELRAANVLCKELQCGEAVPSLMTYTRRPGPIWTEQIYCDGNESRLYDCIRYGIEGNCTKQSSAYIQCK